MTPDRVTFEIRKPRKGPEPSQKVARVVPGALLEGWENPLFWYTWDQSVGKELTSTHASDGRQGLKVSFDLSEYEWPVLLRRFTRSGTFAVWTGWRWTCTSRKSLGKGLSVTMSVKGKKKSHDATPVPLRPGWNTVTVDLDGPWLPPEERAAVAEVQWSLFGTDRKLKGWVVYDNFRAEMKKGGGEPRGDRHRRPSW